MQIGMWWRRLALCLCGIGIIRTRDGKSIYHPWNSQVHQRHPCSDRTRIAPGTGSEQHDPLYPAAIGRIERGLEAFRNGIACALHDHVMAPVANISGQAQFRLKKPVEAIISFTVAINRFVISAEPDLRAQAAKAPSSKASVSDALDRKPEEKESAECNADLFTVLGALTC